MSLIVVGGAPMVEVTDDFNRADGGLGANYVTLVSAPQIVGGKAQATAAGVNTSRVCDARHVTPLSGDAQEIVCTVANPSGTYSNTLGSGAFLRCSAAGDRVAVGITSDKVAIVTYSGGTWTDRGSVASATPNTVRLTAIGNVYTVFVNGSATPAVTWTDSSGVIGIGDTNRFFGVYASSQTNFASTTTYGYGIDSITARDL